MVHCLSSFFATKEDCSEATPLLGPKSIGSINEKTIIYNKQDTTIRLRQLREEMVKVAVDLYVVPTADQHGSEYVGPIDQRRSWISG